MNIIDNRRSTPRISTLFSVDVSGDGGNFAIDIGTGGLKLVSAYPLSEEEQEFRLHLGPEHKVTLMGRPVWQQQMTSGGKTVAGITFRVGQDEARESLRDWLENYRPN